MAESMKSWQNYKKFKEREEKDYICEWEGGKKGSHSYLLLGSSKPKVQERIAGAKRKKKKSKLPPQKVGPDRIARKN